MLVLSATYRSRISELVDSTILQHLLKRTISFLKGYRNISPTLSAASSTLVDVYTELFDSQAL